MHISTSRIACVVASCLSLISGVRAAPGDLDATFDPNVTGGAVLCTAQQADGKTLIAGEFTSLKPPGSVSPVSRNYLARINSDGTLDAAFNPNPNGPVSALAVQDDGKILVAGDFTSLQPEGTPTGASRLRLARLNLDGTLDPTFQVDANGRVSSLSLQPDDKIVAAGLFTSLTSGSSSGPVARRGIARMTATGELDSFDPGPFATLASATVQVNCVALQADGKVVFGGSFDGLQPNGGASVTSGNLARVNEDGTLDTDFSCQPSGPVNSLVCLPNGKIVISGPFSSVRSGATDFYCHFVAQVNADGTAVANYLPVPDRYFSSMQLMADSRILACGGFKVFNTPAIFNRQGYVRIGADGTIDTSYGPSTNAETLSVDAQSDGKVILGGKFTAVTGTTSKERNRAARLLADSVTNKVIATTPSQAIWQRDGSLPEVSQVLFQISTDGGVTWVDLGAGSRATSGWYIAAPLPIRGSIRTTARTLSGLGGGSTGVIRSAPFSFSFNLPDLALLKPDGTAIPNGGTVFLGDEAIGQSAGVQTLTFKNTGAAVLSVYSAEASGPDAGEFVFTQQGPSILTPGQARSFSFVYAPHDDSPRIRQLTLTLRSNAFRSDSNYAVNLTAVNIVRNRDWDGDGMSDFDEFQLSDFGFLPDVAQPALVAKFKSRVASAGYFTADQVQALNIDKPLITRNPQSGLFKLTMAVERSTSLGNYSPFPLVPAQTSINALGELEFSFGSSDAAAFFRVLAK